MSSLRENTCSSGIPHYFTKESCKCENCLIVVYHLCESSNSKSSTRVGTDDSNGCFRRKYQISASNMKRLQHNMPQGTSDVRFEPMFYHDSPSTARNPSSFSNADQLALWEVENSKMHRTPDLKLDASNRLRNPELGRFSTLELTRTTPNYDDLAAPAEVSMSSRVKTSKYSSRGKVALPLGCLASVHKRIVAKNNNLDCSRSAKLRSTRHFPTRVSPMLETKKHIFDYAGLEKQLRTSISFPIRIQEPSSFPDMQRNVDSQPSDSVHKARPVNQQRRATSMTMNFSSNMVTKSKVRGACNKKVTPHLKSFGSNTLGNSSNNETKSLRSKYYHRVITHWLHALPLKERRRRKHTL